MTPQTSSGCWVLGTDTGVGKTVVAAALAACLKRRGCSVGVMKPVETGRQSDWPGTSDAERLRAAVLAQDEEDLIAPYRFPLPLSPLEAARQAGVSIRFERILKAWRTLAGRYRYVLLEGAGGLLVPMTEKEDLADLVRRTGWPAVVVGRSALGGVNQAMLTLEALRARHIPIVGLMLNEGCASQGSTENAQRDGTVRLLTDRAGVPVLGPLPYDALLLRDWPERLRRLSQEPAIAALADLIEA